ncbi:MAG: class I mannose-6-phosphate isomerase [Clostridia bacterium]|nr:class I mannose-6-phosphate isomerase [Clostridia bacterium]
MPLAPILMTPAYRYGTMTPWGGEKLRTLYGKNIPGERTGEGLEVSAIPGLESRDEQGNTLPQLIEKYGEKLVGTQVEAPFPLLLKLLDAKDTLSVQVHPDDAYAKRVENKLGKTEAWHILYAEPGAQLVYGVKENVTREELMAASKAGAQVEGLLRKVNVKAGETYFIPAGMVHAIGAGIVLYEIQQSSDVTYRFYDWERMDKNGNKRELHLEKAIDVTDVTAQLSAAVETEIAPGHFRLLDEKYFRLDRLAGFNGVLPADIRRFAFITATGKTTLSWENGSMELPLGCTAFLPADGYDLQILSEGALISYPSVQ